jgi:hypothetical protein
MVAPERQRQGLGEVLFRTWDRNVGASLGLGLSESSYRLFQKLRWPDVGPLPCLVKPLTRRALRIPNWSVTANRVISVLTLPVVKIVSRAQPLGAEVRLIQRFDDSFTELWNQLSPRFDLAVRRDALLNWKFVSAPHVRYIIAALRRDDRNVGYAVYRHLHEPAAASRCWSIFSWIPTIRPGLRRFSGGSIARRATPTRTRSNLRHARGFRKILKRAGIR